MIKFSGDGSIDTQRFSRKHHKQAFQSLASALNKTERYPRRLQLDAWLKHHDHSLEQGAAWERELNELDWATEYRAVIREALSQGGFYSDAFKKQLHHCYVESERLTLKQQEQLHELELARHQNNNQCMQPFSRSFYAWLTSIIFSIQLFKGF